jgi:hypothetical protein
MCYSSQSSSSSDLISQCLTTREGIQMPKFLYGCAWKEQTTEKYVQIAIKTGINLVFVKQKKM